VFIGINLQNPWPLTGIDACVTAGPFTVPRTLDQSGGKAGGDVTAGIGATIQHHHNFITKPQMGQARGQAAFFVMGHNQGG
jgi:hypothetical protein